MGPPAIAPRTSLLFVIIQVILACGACALLFSGQTAWVLTGGLVLAASAVLALTPVASYLSYQLNVLDKPDERKNHGVPMPLLGGVAVSAGFTVAALAAVAALPGGLARDLYPQLGAILAAGLLVAAMGVADDKWGLKPGIRLLGQLAAACLVMRGGVVISFLPPTTAGRLGEVLLTVIWIVGITNAMNFLDGLDGLASGVSAVAAFSFAAIAGLTGQVAVAVVALCLAGAALGFLRYNFRPASIYLGDSGATFLGFLLACIGLLGDWGTADRAEDLFVPVIILGIPIYDTIYITIYRFWTGRVRTLSEWAAYVGRDHLHHRLEQLGMRASRTCLFICLGGGVLGILAVLLKTKGELDRYDKFLAITLAALLFVGATILMELGKARQGAGRAGEAGTADDLFSCASPSSGGETAADGPASSDDGPVISRSETE